MAKHYLEQVVQFSSAGDQNVQAQVGYLRATVPGTLEKISIYAGGNVSANTIFDVNKNGGSVFASAADRLQINSGSQSVVKSGLSIALAVGDLLTVDVDSSGGVSELEPLVVVFQIEDGSTNGLLPAGGSTGQVLKKNSAIDYDAGWANESGGSSSTGGITYTPLDEGDCVLLLTPSSLTANGDGNTLQTWDDESTANNDPTQATSGNRPKTYLSMINNLPAVHFGGSSDQALVTPNFSFKHVFAVARLEYYAGSTLSTYPGLLSGKVVSNANMMLVGDSGSANWRTTEWTGTPDYRRDGSSIAGAYPYQRGLGGTIDFPAWHIYEISRATGWSDGLVIGNDRLLSGRSFGGQIALVAAFSNVKSSSSRKNIIRYLHKLFNLPVLNPGL
jgi:hypothetical protein